MNEKLKSLLEARKKSKEAKKGFKQTTATKLKGMEAPKDGPKGSGPEGVKVPVKPKEESAIPAFGARFNKLVESTLAAHQSVLEEDDAADLYYDANEMEGNVMSDIEHEDETVTITLDKETAKKLHDLLMAAMGSEEEGGEMEEEGMMEASENEDEEVTEESIVEEEGSYEISQANLAAGEKLAQAASKVVKSKLGARPGKPAAVKKHDSGGNLSAAPAYKQQDMIVKSATSKANSDLF